MPTTVEAQQNARNTSDLLRRFREIGERMRQEYKAPPVLQEQEVKLRVRRRHMARLLHSADWCGSHCCSPLLGRGKGRCFYCDLGCLLHLPGPATHPPAGGACRRSGRVWRSMLRSWRRHQGGLS